MVGRTPTLCPARVLNEIHKIVTALVIIGAAGRVAWLSLCYSLPELPPRLRRVGRLPVSLANPARLAAGTDRLLAVLPPWGLGRCLKRSLFLLDLWSRCGLSPTFHLGVRLGSDGGCEGHAWLAVPMPLATGEPTSGEGFIETWVA